MGTQDIVIGLDGKVQALVKETKVNLMKQKPILFCKDGEISVNNVIDELEVDPFGNLEEDFIKSVEFIEELPETDELERDFDDTLIKRSRPIRKDMVKTAVGFAIISMGILVVMNKLLKDK